jgi:hypothetical protein
MQSLKNKPCVFAMGMLVGAAADFACMRTSTEPEKTGTHESVAKESAAQQPSAGSDARSADLLGASMSPSERADIMAAVRQVAIEEVGSHIQAFAQGAAKRAKREELGPWRSFGHRGRCPSMIVGGLRQAGPPALQVHMLGAMEGRRPRRPQVQMQRGI